MIEYVNATIEYLTAIIFYGLYFGMIVAFISPLYNWFRRL